jgi:uncharacterized protein
VYPTHVLLALLLTLLFSLPAFAAELPALTGRVVDNAQLIDTGTKSSIESKLAAYEAKTSTQIVVATITSLDGEAIEPFANRLFRTWGLGQAGTNNGVLLLVARDDWKMRIEVGYGLEGTLTDLHSKLIIENTMVPAFRAGDLSGGISKAVDDIISVLSGDESSIQPPPAGVSDYVAPLVDRFVPAIFITIWIVVFFGGMAMAILPPIFGRKIGPNKYHWLGMDITVTSGGSSSSGSGWSSGSSSSSSSSGGGFSGGGGSSGGGGASGSW